MSPAGLPPRQTVVDGLLLLGVIAVTAFVWRTLPQGYFYGDDFMNLFRICDRPLSEYLLSTHGGHALVVRNAAFYAFARLFGTQASAYFLVVLLTHLLNTALLFRILRRTTASRWLAAFGATAFGTCPVADGSLAWYSVYGHVLAASALLVSLDVASRAAARGRALTRRESGLVFVLMIAATLSFGTGIAVALGVPVALALVLPPKPGRRWLPPLWGLWIAVPALYVLVQAADDRVTGTSNVAGMHILATVVADNWWRVLEMTLGLVGYGGARLLAGFAPLAFGSAWTMAAGLAILVGASAVAARRGDAATRRWLAAAWVLTLACYGIIALGRVLWWNEQFFVMATQYRYHYTALVTLILVLCCALRAIVARPLARPGAAAGLFGLWLVGSLGAYAAWPPALGLHLTEKREAELAVAWMKARIAAAPPGEDVYLVNRPLRAAAPWLLGPGDFPGWAGLFIIYFPDNTVAGHRVRFIQPDAALIARFTGRRSTGLLIATEDVPKAALGLPDDAEPDAP